MSIATKEFDKKHSIESALRRVSGLEPGEPLTLSGLYGSSKAFVLASLFKRLGHTVLVVLPTDKAAEGFTEDLGFFLGPDELFYYPSTEALPFDSETTHREILGKRIEALFRFLELGPFICAVSAQNLMNRVTAKEILATSALNLRADEESSRDSLVSALSSLGYARMSMVEERGEMSVRGGIVDVFSPGYDSPLRIEFFADMVESIRSFDISTQRSLKELKEARILPADPGALAGGSRERAGRRLIDRADGLDTLFDYLDDQGVIVVIDPSMVAAELERFSRDVNEAAARRKDEGSFFVDSKELYMDYAEASSALKKRRAVFIEPLRGDGLQCLSESNLDLKQALSIRTGPKAEGFLKPLAESVTGWLEAGQKVVLTAHNSGQGQRTRELLEGYGLTPAIIKGRQVMDLAAPGFWVALGALSTGFRLPSEQVVIVSEEEVFGERVKRRPPPQKRLDAFLTELKDLSAGDHIVHALHGIGLYQGLKRLNIDGVENDFLLLEYRDGDRLYQPASRMDLLSRYHGVEGRGPVLDKLGSSGWTRTKGRVKRAVELMAGELLKLYAEREAATGFAFSPPDRLFREFEAGFEYDETPDQGRAIEECLTDMQGPRPMDRLICGDVGYGKTEVAIRAAFKAALDSKQTAVLVPTTVLAQQHYLTFTQRLAPYPVSIDVLSRFCSKKEQRQTIERLGDGRVDIIIGTHKLLQRDVRFKDLGLVIIDEEHRFGVAQKERLKKLRRSVDVLTLTATPIPRTLHMSMASIRDLSIINTPPEDRLAIKTTIIGMDERLIAEAVERELRRGGQVFFVHNRIESIGAAEEFLRRVAPGAKVALAHGQMREAELEKRMLGFVNKEYDLLLCTAIIESGLDIPSANTIIINHAERFGLAELYQLRGRVGRSNHRAYAYFICPESSRLTSDARKRVEVIRELCEPGSGFKIATYDLEIRGAGELLGTSQSGHIAEVGFEMYTQLLEEAVGELKGEAPTEEIEPEIHLKVSQYLSEDYIPDTRQRLGLYKRLASVSTEDELHGISDELLDRYGDVPALAENLISTAGLKLLLKRLKARELVQKGTRLYITLESTDEGGDAFGSRERLVEKLVRMARDEPKRYRLTPDSRLIVFMAPGPLNEPKPIEEARYVLKELVNACYS